MDCRGGGGGQGCYHRAVVSTANFFRVAPHNRGGHVSGHMDFVYPSAMGTLVLLCVKPPRPPFRSSWVVVVQCWAIDFLPRVTHGER